MAKDKSAAIVKPKNPNPEAKECFKPSSISILPRTLFSNLAFIERTAAMEKKKTISPIIIASGDISIPPTLNPVITLIVVWIRISVETPQRLNNANPPKMIKIGSRINPDQKLILRIILRRIRKVCTQKRHNNIRCKASFTALRKITIAPIINTETISLLKIKAERYG